MTIRSLIIFLLTSLALLPFGAAAHPQNREFDPIHNFVFVPPSQNIGLVLKEFPRKDTLFQLRLKDDRTVESCKARFVKKNSPVAIQGCDILTKRFFLPIGEGKKKRNIRLTFVWPKKSVPSFKSNFGGAIPLLLDEWINKFEMRKLAAYNGERHDFVLKAEIGVDGNATNCSIDNPDMSPVLRALVCQQFTDHSFWIPAFDDSTGLVPTQISLQSKIEIGRRFCSGEKGVNLDSKTGVFRWTMLEGGSECLPDFRDFVGPAVN